MSSSGQGATQPGSALQTVKVTQFPGPPTFLFYKAGNESALTSLANYINSTHTLAQLAEHRTLTGLQKLLNEKQSISACLCTCSRENPSTKGEI